MLLFTIENRKGAKSFKESNRVNHVNTYVFVSAILYRNFHILFT